jgi:cytochrome P450 family 4 subfamily B polypeptide 1
LTLKDLPKIINLEKIHDLPYLSYCFKETLRVDSISTTSGLYTAIKDTSIEQYPIKKGTVITVGIHCLHNDPTQWQKPREFIPERFDPLSKYFLTPSGEKRDPINFLPFSVGARNCIGQNLAMTEGKVLSALVALSFDFEFPEELTKKKDVSWSFGSSPILTAKVTRVLKDGY